MVYAAITLAVLGFAVGILFRLQVLMLVIGLLLIFSVVLSIGSGLNFSDALLTIITVQTVVQGTYFLGLIARAALGSYRPWHIL
jgi:hypothetical protein